MKLEWARQIRGQCLEAAVPFFFKQWGGRTPKSGGRVLDGTTWDEMPRVASVRLSVKAIAG
jgi:protein gp37